MAKMSDGIGASPMRAARLKRVTAVAPSVNGVWITVDIFMKVESIWPPAPTTPKMPALSILNATIPATILPSVITNS